MSCEINQEHIVNEAGSDALFAIGSVFDCMLESELGNVISGVLGSTLGVYLEGFGELTSER